MEEIVLFGTGIDAERFYYNNQDIKIKYCLDNYREKERFHGIKILRPNDSNIFGGQIVVAVSSAYEIISKQLKRYGLIEYIDYINCKFCGRYGKKLAVIHGNCHTSSIKKFLESSQAFSDTFLFHPLPPIQLIQEGEIGDSILNHCKLYIHQDIRKDNQYGYKLSDEYTLKQLPDDCVRIAIPNLYGYGKPFFPQSLKSNSLGGPHLKNAMRLFPYEDEIIKQCMERGEGFNEILKRILNDPYPRTAVEKLFNETMEHLLEREKGWDIKISDYILSNYRQKKMFYDIGHPTKEVLHEISKRILLKLKLPANSISCNEVLNAAETPVYPCVKRWLDLEWDIETIRDGIFKLTEDLMDLEEYIREYLFYCY